MLGPGNTEAAKDALRAWPGGLHVTGGITDENARYWIEQGAEKVRIISSLWIERSTSKFTRDFNSDDR